ncbi:LysR family transcriptional regulator [Chromobacterium violaceum]|uniref:LysR family transcriptional regulator n=1 Tax=Chromobacterium violaceum TaxID=536 RepID=UPI001B3303BE|nr:LysR family transcriptional regulator [Chromobacterium violaceum]MBP4046943.1 LysR family transcriptional regulator [Chromobacterium violaceum]
MNAARYAEHLAIFVEVARGGSFSAVARRHGATPSTITRKIDMLEEFVGTNLLVRSTRALLLTEAGETLFARGVSVLEALTDIHNEVIALSDSMYGTLRISCLPTFGKLHVLPWLANLQQRHPSMRIDLDLTERLTNPSVERLDAAIRIGKLKDSSLFAKQIGTQRWVICASPDYLRQRGHPSDLEDLRRLRLRLIDKLHDPHSMCWRRLVEKGHIDQIEAAFRCDDFEAMRQAALCGLGAAFLPDWVIAQDLAAGALIQLFDDPEGREDGIHLVRALPKMSAKLEVFHQALSNHLGQVRIGGCLPASR